ncbi:MAG: hypothetical protein LC689_01675 [Myxococcales bacterium]|nr:hypothetical protein [Myxococcales bacterium]
MNKLIVIALFAAACGGAIDNSASEDDEAWSAAGNPALFSSGLEYKLDALPAQGQAKVIPWTGSYWPTANDNINYRWAGASSDSPAKKYEKAFGGHNLEDMVSKYHGIDSVAGAKSCTANSQCSSADGEICAKRTGQTGGRCIPTWWGICHGWTPASILMPEPKHAVTRNGVTFKVNDLKALASLAHDRTTSRFVSLRCDTGRASGMEFDKYGRPSDEACRDSNAGTYHVLLANYLGKMGKAFAEDRTEDAEVWNQPLRGYKVLEKRVVSAQEANRLIGVGIEGGTVTTKTAAPAKGAWVQLGSFAVAAGQSWQVQMTGSGDADLFVRFGSAPTSGSYACRPYTDGSTEDCSGVVPAGQTTLFVGVHGYTAASVKVSIGVGGSVPSAYVFNAKAKKLVYVRADVQYISEESPAADGYMTPHIDDFTQTDSYEYVLELDGNGRIVGGEWVGESKQAHPDFLWLPTGVGASTVAGGAISYANVKSLIDEAAK